MEFAAFDARGYRTVDARSGYDGWAATYDDSVVDAMDIRLLERLPVDWAATRRALDLGCGTGRTGAWLRSVGVSTVDGVDQSGGMLSRAADRGVHERLVQAPVTDTGLASGSYDLIVCSLVDEHLADLAPLYREAARVGCGGAVFVLVGYHPHFILHTGMPTHFTSDSGEDVAISTTIHLVSDHVTAALDAGWRLDGMTEGLVDDAWIAAKPKWDRHRGHPVSVGYLWRR